MAKSQKSLDKLLAKLREQRSDMERYEREQIDLEAKVRNMKADLDQMKDQLKAKKTELELRRPETLQTQKAKVMKAFEQALSAKNEAALIGQKADALQKETIDFADEMHNREKVRIIQLEDEEQSLRELIKQLNALEPETEGPSARAERSDRIAKLEKTIQTLQNTKSFLQREVTSLQNEISKLESS